MHVEQSVTSMESLITEQLTSLGSLGDVPDVEDMFGLKELWQEIYSQLMCIEASRLQFYILHDLY